MQNRYCKLWWKRTVCEHLKSSLPSQLFFHCSQAVEFRQFWGEKSELRRFKDGGISEAVVWAFSSGLSQKRMVCSKIVTHVLHRSAHCSLLLPLFFLTDHTCLCQLQNKKKAQRPSLGNAFFHFFPKFL